MKRNSLKVFLYKFLLIFLWASLGLSQGRAQTFSAEQTKAIEKITHDYLIAHPQIFVEAAKALQKQQQNQWQQTANQAIPQAAKRLFLSSASPAAGNLKTADVAVVEFFDYACPHCKDLAPKIKDMLKNDPRLKVIFKPLPIFGDTSIFAAKAALAAQKQHKFINFHEALMNIAVPLTQEVILQTAKQTGLDVAQLQKDMTAPEISQEIRQNEDLAKQLKLTGTPGFVLANIQDNQYQKNPLLIPGAVSENILIEAVGQARTHA